MRAQIFGDELFLFSDRHTDRFTSLVKAHAADLNRIGEGNRDCAVALNRHRIAERRRHVASFAEPHRRHGRFVAQQIFDIHAQNVARTESINGRFLLAQQRERQRLHLFARRRKDLFGQPVYRNAISDGVRQGSATASPNREQRSDCPNRKADCPSLEVSMNHGGIAIDPLCRATLVSPLPRFAACVRWIHGDLSLKPADDRRTGGRPAASESNGNYDLLAFSACQRVGCPLLKTGDIVVRRGHALRRLISRPPIPMGGRRRRIDRPTIS